MIGGLNGGASDLLSWVRVRIWRVYPEIQIAFAMPRATMPGMSAEMYKIVSVGIALGALIVNGQAATRRTVAEAGS